MRHLTVTALLVAAALAAAPALAQPFGGPPGADRPGMVGEHMIGRLTDLLNLDAAQQTTLRTLADQLAATVRPLHEQQREAFEQLRATLDGANPDPAAVGRMVIAMHGVRKQVEAARQAFDAGLTPVLTSEQKAVYQAVKEHLHGGPGGPRGMMGGRGPGAHRFGAHRFGGPPA